MRRLTKLILMVSFAALFVFACKTSAQDVGARQVPAKKKAAVAKPGARRGPAMARRAAPRKKPVNFRPQIRDTEKKLAQAEKRIDNYARKASATDKNVAAVLNSMKQERRKANDLLDKKIVAKSAFDEDMFHAWQCGEFFVQ